MITDKLCHRLDRTEWNITVVDRDDEHHDQPGYLLLRSVGRHARQGRARDRFRREGELTCPSP